VVLEIDQNLWGRFRRKIVAFKLYYQKNKLRHSGFGFFYFSASICKVAKQLNRIESLSKGYN